MVFGVVAVLLGLFALAFFWWLPTAAFGLGFLAVAAGLLGRRRLAGAASDTAPSVGQRLGNIGVLLGTAAIVATIIVVVLSTD